MTTASAQIYELPIFMPSTTQVAGFAELYERHYEVVFRAALRVTGNSADAEDVLQTVFLRALARGGDVECNTMWANSVISSITHLRMAGAQGESERP